MILMNVSWTVLFFSKECGKIPAHSNGFGITEKDTYIFNYIENVYGSILDNAYFVLDLFEYIL